MRIQNILTAYTKASKRLLLLDYDGTLVEFNKDPTMATPSPDLLEVLERLASDPRNTMVIISGRSADTLGAWLGHLPLAFSAEHGFFYKKPGQAWQAIAEVREDWKTPVRAMMQEYVELVAGTMLEQKANALSWHWRTANDDRLASQSEKKLHARLIALAGEWQFRVLRGNKVIEVHPVGHNKGTATQYWIEQDGYDFILAAGDDTTDEDIFRTIPAEHYAIKIGPGATAATSRLASPGALRIFLGQLAHVTDHQT